MRPRLHLTPERGWLNDPHGITAYDGRYHVFHQAVPDSLTHRIDCVWAHAISTDLLHFEHQPPALVAGDGDAGIWTGALAIGPAGPLILYTSVTEANASLGRVRLAAPTEPSWETWDKGAVVVEAPADPPLTEFRDPFVLREDDGWRMFCGAASRDGRALALTWTSPDLETWTYDGIALERAASERDPWMGAMWECPQFVDLDGLWAMVGSVWEPGALHHAGYAVGDLDAGRFAARGWGRLTWGTYYAPSLFTDLDGRTCLMHWMREVRGPEWTGCLSVPHVLGRDGDRPTLEPHPVLTQGRAEPVPSGPLPDAAVDVEWSGRPGESLSIGVTVAGDALHVGDHTMPRGSLDRPVRLLLDGPALEVWADGRALGVPVEPATSLTGDGDLALWRLESS